MSDPFIGEIRMFAGTFAPRGWALCDGQLLSVSQNNNLFLLLGTTYGGDGTDTFALPDFRGRSPVHAGQGPGLDRISLGDKGGGAAAGSEPVTTGISTDRNLSITTETWDAMPAGAQSSTPRLFINFIIALTGLYPSRT